MKETIGIDLSLSAHKKIESLCEQYDEPSDVIDDAVNRLVRGQTLRDFFDYLDLLKNVTRAQGLTVDEWIEKMEGAFSDEELRKKYLLDVIRSYERREKEERI